MKIISENYDLVNQSRRKCEIYRDTNVSKNHDGWSFYMQDLKFKELRYLQIFQLFICYDYIYSTLVKGFEQPILTFNFNNIM